MAQSQRVLTVDERRRITLPPQTGAEPGMNYRAIREIDGRITLHPLEIVAPTSSTA